MGECLIDQVEKNVGEIQGVKINLGYALSAEYAIGQKNPNVRSIKCSCGVVGCENTLEVGPSRNEDGSYFVDELSLKAASFFCEAVRGGIQDGDEETS